MQRRYLGTEKYKLRNHRIGWKPSHEEIFSVSVKTKLLIPLFLESALALRFELVSRNHNSLRFLKKSNDLLDRKLITIRVVGESKVFIQSKSLIVTLWDIGRNYENVLLLKRVSEKILAESSKEELEQLVDEDFSSEDFRGSIQLPLPKKNSQKGIGLVIVYGVIGVVASAIMSAITFHNEWYFLFIAEEIVFGITLSVLMSKGIRKSNYLNSNVLLILSVFFSLLIILSTRIFEFFMHSPSYQEMINSFIIFWQNKIDEGFYYLNVHFRSGSLYLLWCFQFIVVAVFSNKVLKREILKYERDRVPGEVLSWIHHALNKGDSEEQIRSVMSKLGWNKKSDQDQAFRAIEASAELNYLEKVS